jgi:hypothetical protein
MHDIYGRVIVLERLFLERSLGGGREAINVKQWERSLAPGWVKALKEEED